VLPHEARPALTGSPSIVEVMIIWRGWGALPIAIAAACIGLGVAMSSANPGLRSIFVGLMLMAGGVGTWFLGQCCSRRRPRSGVR